jgi:phosphohistidine swiveling domain-containing protein
MSQDPLHRPGGWDTHWTTDNVGEALPGVVTPLGWTFWGDGMDQMCRDVAYALGIFTAAERASPAVDEDRIISVFYGRIALRLEWLGAIGDRMPGTSGPEAISGMLGRVPPTMTFHPTPRRWPMIAARLPRAALTSPRRIRSLAAATSVWWEHQKTQASTSDAETARRAFHEGLHRFHQVMTIHGIGLFSVVNPLIQALGTIVERAGVGDVGLLSGTGGAEMSLVEDLWSASRGRMSVHQVADRHGYHGPREGEIASRVWRENPGPLEHIIATYASRDEQEDPILHNNEARARLPMMQAQVTAQFPAWQRPAIRALLIQAARIIPLRGVGKVSFLQALDGARAAARRLGELACDKRVLDEADDIFFLTVDELLAGVPADAKTLVAERRAIHVDYSRMRLPASWRGLPDVGVGDSPESEEVAVVTGVGASAGEVTGVARVVTDPSFAEVGQGEVLVAHTTDPSWAAIMFFSAALVVDIGGTISHAAVVARELGLPCVVNTRSGTTAIHDGDLVRVDGTRGTVEILERADQRRIEPAGS